LLFIVVAVVQIKNLKLRPIVLASVFKFPCEKLLSE
jgi:hypothetical protein